MFSIAWLNGATVHLNINPIHALRNSPFDLRNSQKIEQYNMKKVFVSGCYDLLHSGHVEFFQQASQFGELYVGIGSDATYLEYKHRKPMFPQESIAHYSAMDDVLAWKMPGAGGGGYLALVVKDAKEFIASHPEAFELKIRRE